MHAASVYPEPGSNSPKETQPCGCVSFRGFDLSHILTEFPATLQLLRCGLRGRDRLRRRSPMMGPADRSVKPDGRPGRAGRLAAAASGRARGPNAPARARRRMVWGLCRPVNCARQGRNRQLGQRPRASLTRAQTLPYCRPAKAGHDLAGNRELTGSRSSSVVHGRTGRPSARAPVMPAGASSTCPAFAGRR